MKYNYEIVKNIIEFNGYFLFSPEYINNKNKIIISDSDNYFYEVTFYSFLEKIKNNKKYNRFDSGNNFTIINILNWIDINNKNFVLLSKEYKNRNSKLEFKCNICSEEFTTSWDSVYWSNSACPYCAGLKVGKYNNLLFVNKEIANEWNYEKNFPIKPENVTAHSCKRFYWICKICNYGKNDDWITDCNTRISKRSGCPNCYNNNRSKITSNAKLNDNNSLINKYPNLILEWSIKNSILISDISYGSRKKVWWKCLNGHKDYLSSVYSRTKNNTGCPICKSSKGEKRIIEFLQLNNINFLHQYKFRDCFDKKVLIFDFYLEKYNVIIEYQGELHFISKSIFGGSKKLRDRKNKDIIKKEYCKKNNINFLEINYWDFNNIEKILEKTLNFQGKEV